MSDEYSISGCGEIYEGIFKTEEEAISEAIGQGLLSFHVGVLRRPISPENYWHAEDWLEHVSCQDDYSGEWAEDWDNSTRREREELEDSVRKLMREWLEKYNNMPSHFCVEDSVQYVVENGVAIRK